MTLTNLSADSKQDIPVLFVKSVKEMFCRLVHSHSLCFHIFILTFHVKIKRYLKRHRVFHFCDKIYVSGMGRSI